MIKKQKILIVALMCLPILAMTSCGSSKQADNLVTLINNNFEDKAKLYGNASNKDDAASQYLTEINNKLSEEVIFSEYNFLGQPGFKINDKNVLKPEDNFTDLIKQGTIRLSTQYVNFIKPIENSKFKYSSQGYATVQFTQAYNDETLNIHNKKGDFVQFVYDIQNEAEATILMTEAAGKFIPSITYTINALVPTYGFIKSRLNTIDQTTYAITDINDCNFAAHILNNGYYSKQNT